MKTSQTIFTKPLTLVLVALTFLTVTSCSDNSQTKVVQQAVAIESGDECHLCGMIIQGFSGPKGEANRKESPEKIVKFCSTRDLLSYYFDPENQRNVSQLFVHDMSKTPWQKPSDEYFIDGKSAWYVVGSEKMGAMGKTLASFSSENDAVAFAGEFGGHVFAFADLTNDLLH